jgi:methionine biosynthesis protein MetW
VPVGKSRWRLGNGEVVEFVPGLRQDAAMRLVQAGGRLLDVGCSHGAVPAALQDRFDEVHGIDANPEGLALAEARGVRVQQANFEREPLPYADETFDAVLCLEVIEHVLDPPALVREIHRVLRPAGRIYLSTPNIRFVRYLWALVVGGRFPLTSSDEMGWQGGHVHFFTFADVEDVLHETGFAAVQHHGLAAGPYAPVASRIGRLGREFLSVGIFAIAEKTAA